VTPALPCAQSFSTFASGLSGGPSVVFPSLVGLTIRFMSSDLTDAELATAATACRAMAYQEEERAKKMENPTTRGPSENAAKRYAALAAKF
jgi:hypothetical protein